MPRPISELSMRAAELAARPQGVSCRELRDATGRGWDDCGNRLNTCEKIFGLFKIKPEGHHTRWFISEAQFQAWWATKPAPPPPAIWVRKPRKQSAVVTPAFNDAPVTFPRPPVPRVEPISAPAPAPGVVWRARPVPGPAAYPAQAAAVGQPTGVPGWGGPPIRAGALDFKRHQHKGGF